jgi:hypothetical protein
MLVVVALVLGGACGGSGGETAANRLTTSSIGPDSTNAPPGSETTTSAAPGGATPTIVRGRTGTVPTPGQTTAPTPAPPPAQPDVKFTAPGKYAYRVTGTESGQRVDRTAELVVDPPNGADQRHSQQTQEGRSDTIFRHQPDGIYVVSIVVTQGFIQKEFRPNPPALTLPQPASLGRTWSWTASSTDRRTTLHSSFKILRTENQTIGGEVVPTVVVELTTTTSGDVQSTAENTLWISENYRLIVRVDENERSQVGQSQTSSVLISTKPS